MILMFLIGGIISSILCHYFSVRAIWGALPFLLLIFIRLLVADLTYEKGLLGNVPRGH
jgi:uncharacterized membrane protein YoaK (UPF0700 family)